jgi:hypothetical protein
VSFQSLSRSRRKSCLVPVAGRSVAEKLEVATGNCRIEFVFEAQFFSRVERSIPYLADFFAAYLKE